MDAKFYTMTGQSLSGQEAQIANLEKQLASGTRVSTAATDPAAYVGAQQDYSSVRQLDSMNASQVNVRETLGAATSALGQVSTALDQIQSIALEAVNGTTSSDDFQALSQQVGEGLQQIISLSNTQSKNGNYVFAGTAKQTQPFIQGASGSVSYVGDNGNSSVEISPGVTVNSALSGSVFTNASSGNGYASVSAAAGNSGSATVLATGISNAASATAFHDGSTPITLSFASSASGGTTYTATSGSSTIASGPVAQAAGGATTLTVSGIEFSLSGRPAAGDSFTVAPSRPQTIFDLAKRIATSLASPGTTPAARARTRQLIGNSLGTIIQYQKKIASTSARAGVVMQATDNAAKANALAITRAQTNASTLVSADVPKVISELQARTTALQAAMKAFSVASQLSLFKYL